MKRSTLRAALAVLAAGVVAPAAAVAADPPYAGQVTTVARGLSRPMDAVRAPDGSLLVALSGANEIVRVSPAGTQTVVAGTGEYGSAGDGGPATAAQLADPRGVAALPGGGFLIAEYAGGRIRRVAPDGTIRTVAGGGILGAGCPGPRMAVRYPEAVVATPDDGFVAATLDGVLRGWSDGSVTRLASRATTYPSDVAVDRDGSILVGYPPYLDVDRIAKDGTRTRETLSGGNAIGGLVPLVDGSLVFTSPDKDVLDLFTSDRQRSLLFAGTGSAGAADGSALAATFDAPYGLAGDPAGGVLVADTANGRIRHVETSVAPVTAPPNATGGSQPTGGVGGACRGLDRAFAGGGVTLPGPAISQFGRTESAVDGQGRIVEPTVNGTNGRVLGLVRLKADGTKDPAFGTGGLATGPDEGREDVRPRDVARLSSGGYVATYEATPVGTNVPELRIAAFTAAGAPDPAFAGGHSVLLTTQRTEGGAISIAAGDVIRVAGSSADGHWRVWRLDAHGASLGAWQPASSDAGGSVEHAVGTSGGGLLISAWDRVGRLRPDGSLDPAFGGGIVHFPFTVLDAVPAPGGGVLVVGADVADKITHIVRVRDDGTADPAFTPATFAKFLPSGLAMRSDGRIVVAGGAFEQDAYEAPGLVGTTAAGAPDPAMGPDGRLVTGMPEAGALWTAVHTAPDGELVATGKYDFGRLIVGKISQGATGADPPAPPPPGPPAPDRSPAPDGRPAQVDRPATTEVRSTAADQAPAAAASASTATADAPQAPAPAAGRTERSSATVGLTLPVRLPSVRTLARDGLAIVVRAPHPGTAAVRLWSGRRTLGRARAAVGASGRRALRVRLDNAVSRRWQRRAPRHVTLHLTVRIAGEPAVERVVRLG